MTQPIDARARYTAARRMWRIANKGLRNPLPFVAPAACFGASHNGYRDGLRARAVPSLAVLHNADCETLQARCRGMASRAAELYAMARRLRILAVAMRRAVGTTGAYGDQYQGARSAAARVTLDRRRLA